MTNKPEIKLGYTEPSLTHNAQEIPHAPKFADLWGTIRRVSAAPTWIPRGRLEDSLALYINGVTYRLYIYDHVGGAWRYATLT